MTREDAVKHLDNMKWLLGVNNTTVDDIPLTKVIDDIIALLKAQEPVNPKKNDVEFVGLRTWDWACPECNCILIYRANYCSCCGRAVKWE